jgi:polar amino acid transport system ATP-binding protein
VIQVERLVKRHGTNEVLRGVELQLGGGGVDVLIGPSGAGKSSLLRCLNGLEPFDEGLIRVGEHLLGPGNAKTEASTLRQVRRRVGLVFQRFHLFAHLSVLGNLTLAPMLVLGERDEEVRARAEAWLRRVGLLHKRDAAPHQLSGGEQQRVAIVRALMMRPDVVLLDEPTSALDPMAAGEVMSVLADLALDGPALVVVTHSMALAREVADRVHVLSEGVVVESGPAEKIWTAPEQPVTQAFLRRRSA